MPTLIWVPKLNICLPPAHISLLKGDTFLLKPDFDPFQAKKTTARIKELQFPYFVETVREQNVFTPLSLPPVCASALS